MIGPPIGVEPRKATVQRAITRPRISGGVWVWSTELALVTKIEPLAPIGTTSSRATGRFGASAATVIVTPNAHAASVTYRKPIDSRLADTSEPARDPTLVADSSRP